MIGLNSRGPMRSRDSRRLRRALHPINGDQKIGPLQYFDQFVEDYPLVIAGPGFQVFFENALRVSNGLKSELFIRHPLASKVAVALARAVRIERMSQKDADAEEGKQCYHDLGHRLAPSVTMPGRAALRK